MELDKLYLYIICQVGHYNTRHVCHEIVYILARWNMFVMMLEKHGLRGQLPELATMTGAGGGGCRGRGGDLQ